MKVIPIRHETPRDRRERAVEAAMRAIEGVEREQPWLTRGECPPGHGY
jgi:hypothetical protein